MLKASNQLKKLNTYCFSGGHIMSGLFKMQRKWIKKYIGDDKCVKTNKSITRILEGAFMNCSVITQITIPGIHYIGENAFKDCINL